MNTWCEQELVDSTIQADSFSSAVLEFVSRFLTTLKLIAQHTVLKGYIADFQKLLHQNIFGTTTEGPMVFFSRNNRISSYPRFLPSKYTVVRPIEAQILVSPIPHTNKSTKRHLWIEECWFRNNWFEAQSRAGVSSEQSWC